MTTTFSFPRLLQLIRKHWFENSRLYFFSTLALLGLLGLVFTFWIATGGKHYTEDVTYFIFIGGIYIAGGVFASMSFNILADRPKATYWLSFPASHLEKLVTVIFYSTIVFTIIYCACFFVVKGAADLYIEGLVQDYPSRYRYTRVKFNDGFGQVFTATMYGFFAVQAFYLLGSVYFSRYSFVVTTIVGAALIFLFVYYMAELWTGSLDTPYRWEGTRVVEREASPQQESVKSYELSAATKSVLNFAVKFIWAPVFWVVAWFRLKEKQV